MLYTTLYMASTRTQIYLTDDQRRRLDARGRRTGAPLARMIREAVDAYLGDDGRDVEAALDETFGKLPELTLESRDEWDRGAGGPDPRR
jgi:predicted DNA-binding protein